MCAGRHSKRTRCQLKSVLIYEVEKKIAEHYATIALSPELRPQVEAVILEQIHFARTNSESERRDLARERDKMERQRSKLMEAPVQHAA